MTDPIDKARHVPQEKKTGRVTRKTAIIVGVVCVGVVATLVAMNLDRLAAGPAANVDPVILGVTPSTERLRPLDICHLVCEAVDDDEDALTYTWTVSQGDIVGQGPSVDWVAPDAEGLFSVTATVADGKGGSAEYSISLSVKHNSAPEFLSVPSFAEGVRPRASVSVSCSAVDAEGDDITYEWGSNYGEVRGEGDSITWIAPEALGSYVVTVTARDSFGSQVTRNILISVTPSPTPRLGKFVVEPIGHDMMNYELGVWEIYLRLSCSIECVVLEGDEPYTYEWSVDEGTLTADGSTAIWEAPGTRGPATITVAVTDAAGNTNSAQALMYVEDCTCAFE